MHISNAKINFHASSMATHQANGENHRKADNPNGQGGNEAIKVTISHAGKMLSEFSGHKIGFIKGAEFMFKNYEEISSLREQATAFKADFETSERTNPNSSFWTDLIYSKVDEQASKAYDSKNFTIGYTVFTEDAATRAQNREEARAIAEYMAANNFDDPNEAKAFMDRINEMISEAEKRDKEANADVRKDGLRKFAYEEMGYTDETWVEHTYENRREFADQRREITAAAIKRFYEEKEKGLNNDFFNLADVGEGKQLTWDEICEAKEKKLSEEGDISEDAKGTFYKYAEHYFNLWKTDRQNASLVQSLIDNAKEQVKATPIEDLLAKHGVSVKVA